MTPARFAACYNYNKCAYFDKRRAYQLIIYNYIRNEKRSGKTKLLNALVISFFLNLATINCPLSIINCLIVLVVSLLKELGIIGSFFFHERNSRSRVAVKPSGQQIRNIITPDQTIVSKLNHILFNKVKQRN